MTMMLTQKPSELLELAVEHKIVQGFNQWYSHSTGKYCSRAAIYRECGILPETYGYHTRGAEADNVLFGDKTARCPAEDCTLYLDHELAVSGIVMHLNDSHRWPFLRIALFLKMIGL